MTTCWFLKQSLTKTWLLGFLGSPCSRSRIGVCHCIYVWSRRVPHTCDKGWKLRQREKEFKDLTSEVCYFFVAASMSQNTCRWSQSGPASSCKRRIWIMGKLRLFQRRYRQAVSYDKKRDSSEFLSPVLLLLAILSILVLAAPACCGLCLGVGDTRHLVGETLELRLVFVFV